MRIRSVRILLPLLLTASLLVLPAGALAAGSAAGETPAAAPATTDVLRELNEALKSENESLQMLNQILRAENEALKQENSLLRSELEKAQKRLMELEAKLGPATTVEALAAQLKPRVFRVDVYDYGGRLISTGSAVAVSPTDVVTNFHVVEKAWSAELVTEAGTRHTVLGLTAFDEARDLALLRVSGPLEPVTLRSTPARTGEEVVAIGSPVGLTNTVSTGIVSAVRTMDGMEVIQVTAPISHGSSGGGLFDREGNLIGITFAMLVEGQNLNFAIPVRYVQDLIAAAGPPGALPGVSRVTPENLIAVLRETLPALDLNGFQVAPEYYLVPLPRPAPGQAPGVLAVVLDNAAWYNFLSGMLTGDLRANMKTVEDFMIKAGELTDQAYGELDVMLILVHIGEYRFYPSGFDYDEVEFDWETGMWQVFHPELILIEADGRWYWEWQ